MSRSRWVLGAFAVPFLAAGVGLMTGEVTIADLSRMSRRPGSSETAAGETSAPPASEGRPAPIANAIPAGEVITEGRVASYPGASVVVSAEYTGTLTEVNVEENQHVRKGDVLARMRCDDLKASRALAEAELAEATAEEAYWEKELARLEALDRKKATPRTELDAGRRSLDVMRSRQAHARAGIAMADALIAKMQIVAPIDGLVVSRSAHPGETLTLGSPIVKLVDLNRTRIEAEVDEYDVGRVAAGAPCVVTAEGFPGRTWAGRVEEVPADVVPRKIRPEDPARPADTRVVLVKVAFAEEVPFKLGQRVYVSIRKPAADAQ